jgi:transketolase
MPPSAGDLRGMAEVIRREVVRVAVKNHAGHIASSLSCVDILVALYYGVMRCDRLDTRWEKRDRLVLSKGHGCYALYAILSDVGLMPKSEWENFNTPESTLKGCVERNLDYGIEAGCGSLGHGLPMAVGMAFAAKLQHKSYFVYCIVGDGELQEGSNWEALQFAVHHELGNLVVIVDANGLQAMDWVDSVYGTGIKESFRGFDLDPEFCDGNNTEALSHALQRLRAEPDSVPSVVIAETTKGFGLLCMEHEPMFHFRVPTKDELAIGWRSGEPA